MRLAKQAASQSRWGFLVLHGISQGSLPVANVELCELCHHLARARRIQTTPFVEVPEAVRAWRGRKSS